MIEELLYLDEREKLKPVNAAKRLESLGFTQDMWEDIIENKLISHEVRALITIATGTEPRLLGQVYREERVKDGLPPERLADRRK